MRPETAKFSPVETDPDILNCRVGRLVARAWTDEAFRDLLSSDPAAAFAQFEVPVPPGMTLKVLFDREGLTTFVIPAPISPA